MNDAVRSPRPEGDASAGWQASLRLGFTAPAEKTLLSERRHLGPLTVQRPFYPEGSPCHVYLLHPPGGVVGGDRLNIDVEVKQGAHALLTTPGASKFYRSAGPLALQQQDLRLHDGTLEWLPQENILFPGARLRLESRIQLSSAARFIGWEIHCLGRPAIGELFDRGEVSFRLALYRAGKPLLIDRWQVCGPADLQGSASLRNHPVVATWLATGADDTALELARATLPQPLQGHLGITLLGELLVARYLGDSTEEARRLFLGLWSQLRPLLIDREACPPRIWAT